MMGGKFVEIFAVMFTKRCNVLCWCRLAVKGVQSKGHMKIFIFKNICRASHSQYTNQIGIN